MRRPRTWLQCPASFSSLTAAVHRHLVVILALGFADRLHQVDLLLQQVPVHKPARAGPGKSGALSTFGEAATLCDTVAKDSMKPRQRTRTCLGSPSWPPLPVRCSPTPSAGGRLSGAPNFPSPLANLQTAIRALASGGHANFRYYGLRKYGS